MLFGSLLLSRGTGGGGGGGGSGTGFVALSSVSTGAAAYSADGITWIPALMPVAAPFSSVAWNGNVFCAVGNAGIGSFVAATSPDGINWTARQLPQRNQWNSISWNGNLFVATANDLPQESISSPDGINWTIRSGLYAGANIAAVKWANFPSNFPFTPLFIAPSASSPYSQSSDGINWSTSYAMPTNDSYGALSFNGSTVVAIKTGSSSSLSATIINSVVGTGATARSMSSAHTWTSVAWNGKVFCAVCNDAAIAATSPDGVTWTDRTMAGDQPWSSIAWNGKVFCAVADTADDVGHSAATSPDGVTWTYQTMPAIDNWSTICSQQLGNF